MQISFLDRLPPKFRKAIVVGGGLGAVGLFVYLVTSTSAERAAPHSHTFEHVLMDVDTRSLSMDALAARIENMRQEMTRLGMEQDQLNEAMRANRAQTGIADSKRLGVLEAQLNALAKQVTTLKQAPARAMAPPTPKVNPAIADGGLGRELGGGVNGHRPQGLSVAPTAPGTVPSLNEIYGPHTAAPGATGATGENLAQMRSNPTNPENEVTISTIKAPAPKVSTAADASTLPVRVIPAGSILSGTLITGLDAPTNQGARQDPFPAVLRVKKDAILPNRYRADLKECFILMSGYGDLSSERAIMRGERLSCIARDGKVLEARLPAYVVGSDGKVGVRGRLVSKQGALLAEALMAGFAHGLAGAFSFQQVPSLNIAPSQSGAMYQNQFNANALRQGVSGGAGTALNELAQFYISMAQQMFPVIEVDAGRQVDMVVTSTISLHFTQNAQAQSNPLFGNNNAFFNGGTGIPQNTGMGGMSRSPAQGLMGANSGFGGGFGGSASPFGSRFATLGGMR